MNFDDTPHSNDFYVQEGRQHLDLDWTTSTLLSTYWGVHRTREQIAASLMNSKSFGLFYRAPRDQLVLNRDRQVGFVRVVSDLATFSWICDMVIDPDFRKRKLGTFLLQTVIHHRDVAPTVIHLSTRDCFPFYARMGFERQGWSNVMRKIPNNPAPQSQLVQAFVVSTPPGLD